MQLYAVFSISCENPERLWSPMTIAMLCNWDTLCLVFPLPNYANSRTVCVMELYTMSCVTRMAHLFDTCIWHIHVPACTSGEVTFYTSFFCNSSAISCPAIDIHVLRGHCILSSDGESIVCSRSQPCHNSLSIINNKYNCSSSTFACYNAKFCCMGTRTSSNVLITNLTNL